MRGWEWGFSTPDATSRRDSLWVEACFPQTRTTSLRSRMMVMAMIYDENTFPPVISILCLVLSFLN